jgi:hypothetical protein
MAVLHVNAALEKVALLLQPEERLTLDVALCRRGGRGHGRLRWFGRLVLQHVAPACDHFADGAGKVVVPGPVPFFALEGRLPHESLDALAVLARPECQMRH